MRKTVHLAYLVAIILIWAVLGCNYIIAQNSIPTTINGSTYTMKGQGYIGGYKDTGRLHRFIAPVTGNVGLQGYFQSLTNVTTSQSGLGLIVDGARQQLKGNRPSIYAFFEMGGIMIKHRTTVGGAMLNLAFIPNVPIPAWLKMETSGNNVSFYYSTSSSNSTMQTWTTIGTYNNVLVNWDRTQTRKTLAITSGMTSAQTAVITNVQELVPTGAGAYDLVAINVAKDANDSTLFHVTPTEANRPTGDLNYSLVIKDLNGNVWYNNSNIPLNTATYPYINFNPGQTNLTPHLTTAGTYNVCLTANSITKCKAMTFTNVNLGITTAPPPPTGGGTTNGGNGSSSLMQFSNNLSYTAPASSTTPTLKLIDTKDGFNGFNGSRTLNISMATTADPNSFIITVNGSSANANEYARYFVNGIMLGTFSGGVFSQSNKFIVKKNQIYKVLYLYGDPNSEKPNQQRFGAGVTKSAMLLFNVI